MLRIKFAKVENGKFHAILSMSTWALNGIAHCGLSMTDDEMDNLVIAQRAPIKQRCMKCCHAMKLLKEV